MKSRFSERNPGRVAFFVLQMSGTHQKEGVKQ